jgi:hypothetical protein
MLQSSRTGRGLQTFHKRLPEHNERLHEGTRNFDPTKSRAFWALQVLLGQVMVFSFNAEAAMGHEP